MSKYNNNLYRVTPKKNKGKVTYVIQRKSDRSTMKVEGHPFINQTAANEAMIKLMVDQNKSNQKNDFLFVEEFRKFADWNLSHAKDGARVTTHSMKRYLTEYNLRISKYIDHDLSLKDFDLKQMEAYLDKLKAADVPYKTMSKSVADIKYFLRRMVAEGKDPNTSQLKFQIHKYHNVVPEDDDLYFGGTCTEDQVNIFTDEKVIEILQSLKQRWKANDYNAANLAAIFVCFFFFGLRKSELQGLKMSSIDLDKFILKVQGTWTSNTYKNKTKHQASKRSIEISQEAAEFLRSWFEYRKKWKPDNPFFVPGKTINGKPGPVSDVYIRDNLWKLYAEHGLAEISIEKGGHVSVISSPLKGYQTKVFRHRFGSALLANLNNPMFNPNRVKGQLGHKKFSTSSDIYGNKQLRGTEEERKAFAEARAKANKDHIVTKGLLN